MRQIVLIPLLYLCFSVVSLSVISSIAPSLFSLQLIFFLLGACVMIGVSMTPFTIWKKFHWYFYAGSIMALCLTLVLGVVHKGAARWIPIGPVNFQPSQFAQPLTIITISFFLSNHSLKKWQNVCKLAAITLIPWFLTIIEPNLSTSLIFLFFATMMAIQADLPTRWIFTSFLTGVILLIIGWIFVIHPYQKQRILTFLSPEKNQETGYNAQQSVIAVGSGGLLGRGLGHGIQSQLRFLPERQTDFIFASLAEELGLAGSYLVIGLYAVLFLFISIKLRTVKSVVFQSILIGLLSFFIIQVGVNIGMNTGILPITGITLPLLSYGGSSLLSFSLCFGILERIMIESNDRQTFRIK